MTLRPFATDADGLAAPAVPLPAAFVHTVIPLVVYAMVARGTATVDSWSVVAVDAGVETHAGSLAHVELLPSIWVLLLCVAIAAVGHGFARDEADARRAAQRRAATTMTIWAVVGLATFGGWAWLVLASTLGTDVGVPFPLMGTVSALH